MSRYIGLEKRRILVVEDVELNQYLARHIMESWGCTVDIVENGSIAIDRIRDSDYDLVLMDIQMPVMDGMEATKRIRELDDNYRASVPIVALTANSQKADCEHYLRIGMNDWLGKPFEEPALYETVTRNIRKTLAMHRILDMEEIVEESKEQVEIKLYDLSMIQAISGGDQGFVVRMLALFVETVPKTLEDISSAAEAGEWLTLSKHAHKLKSTIDSMGIASLKQDIRDIELGGKAGGEPVRLRALVRKVLEVMEQVVDQVKEGKVKS